MTSLVEEQRLQGIAQLLVHEGLLEKEDALQYQIQAKEEKIALLNYLINKKILQSDKIAKNVAESFGVPMLDMDSVDPDSIPLPIVNEKLIRRHMMIPLHVRGNNLFLATDDPSKQVSLKEIQFHTGLHSNAIVVESDKLTKFISSIL